MRPIRLVAVVAWAPAASLAVALPVALAVGLGDESERITFGLGLAFASLVYAGLGGLLASRLPRHPIGWLFGVAGLALGTTLITRMVVGPPASGAEVGLAWLGSWIWTVAFGAILLAVLLFPDGRLLGRGWRALLALDVVAPAVLAVGVAFSAGPLGDYPYVTNPFGTATVSAMGLDGGGVGWLLVLMAFVGTSAAAILRFRRARGVERLQGRWFAWAAGIMAVEWAVLSIASDLPGLANTAASIAFPLALSIVPISIAIAVLRYRLYEIDRLVSRTIGYGILTAMLAAVFTVGVLGLQLLLVGFTRGGSLAVALSTLAVFALFQPLRRRVQRVVDRRFHRARYDAEWTAATLAARLRDPVDLSTVVAEIETTVTAVMAPTSLRLWVRRGHGG